MAQYYIQGKHTPYFLNDGNNRKRLESLTIDQLFYLAKVKRCGIKKILVEFLVNKKL